MLGQTNDIVIVQNNTIRHKATLQHTHATLQHYTRMQHDTTPHYIVQNNITTL